MKQKKADMVSLIIVFFMAKSNQTTSVTNSSLGSLTFFSLAK